MAVGFMALTGVGGARRRDAVIMAKKGRRPPPAAKKGFQKREEGSDALKEDVVKDGEVFVGGSRKPPESLENYVPQGPTMRAYYEKTGKMAGPDPDENTLPEIVAQRMLGRMVPLFGIPLFLGTAGFGGLFYAKTKYDITFMPSFVAFSTLGMFALALFGLTYGIMSASWDEDIEGSWLGFREARTNISRTAAALRRTRSDEQVTEALDELESRSKK